jgi:hypothetical protein
VTLPQVTAKNDTPQAARCSSLRSGHCECYFTSNRGTLLMLISKSTSIEYPLLSLKSSDTIVTPATYNLPLGNISDSIRLTSLISSNRFFLTHPPNSGAYISLLQTLVRPQQDFTHPGLRLKVSNHWCPNLSVLLWVCRRGLCGCRSG